ncbi:MAG: copper-translocating P-type ATPase [Lachnospira sp.]|nr:copper-translocating P-type ATPase [Lachnospira sp.]
MREYTVTGMHCAACSARVEKTVAALQGVDMVSVSLLTNSMVIEGNVAYEELEKAIKEAGFLIEPKKAIGEEEAILIKSLKIRLIASIVLMIPLMIIAMGFAMHEKNVNTFIIYIAVEMLLALAVMIINKQFFISGVKGVIKKAPNMDTLVALGSFASFVYSAISFAGLVISRDLSKYMHGFYFESAAMILTLITVGKLLEAYSKGKTTNALKALLNLAPARANVIRDDKEINLLVENMTLEDIFVVKPGEAIPADGVIIEGSSAVNEASLTGESIPVDKEVSDEVSAGTLNQSGFIKCKVTRLGSDTTLSKIIKAVSDAAATKAPIAKVADKVAGIFVPVVILIAIITTIVWMLITEDFGHALMRGISVLVISCPCSLGLATPVAIMVGNGIAAKNGILFKTAAALELTGGIGVVALDKTGTLTHGEPIVTNIIPYGISNKELLELAYALEVKSEHPLAKAINKLAISENVKVLETKDFEAISGNGLRAKLNDSEIFAGNLKFVSDKLQISKEAMKKADEFANEGKTPLYFAKDNVLVGIIAVADSLKEDSIETVAALKADNIKVVMITGDNEKTAKAIAEEVKVDEVIAGVLPSGKADKIESLSKYGKVAMVGDGINDAIALTNADIGIAIGAGTDVAIDAADVVLIKNRLRDVHTAIRISKRVKKTIHQNLFWAFIYNIIGIPLAAGVFVPILGWELNPMFGAAAMSLSSFCVISNALRLNFFKY